VNEPVRSYAPGTPEREELRVRLAQMERERISIPMVIGGKEVETKETTQAVMPHRKEHVLADVAKGGPEHVQLAVDAAREAHADWSRLPWEERASVYLRAAELLAGPWRSTLVAATMLNQSKTAHQAEIDAAAELVDFWRFNVEFMLRIYSEQPVSSPGVWNRMEYRPLEGFVFAVSPFNFTAIGGNLSGSPALMGNAVVWKPASSAALSAHYTLQLLREAGLPDGVINLVYGSGATIGDAALASPELAGIHFTGSTPVFQSMWKTVGANIASYKNYPRIVGETGGKVFILAHSSADVDEVATAIVRGSFEYQGQKCSAASRVYIPQSLWNQNAPAFLKLLSIQRPDSTAFTNSNIDFRIEGDDLAFERIDFSGDAISLKGKGRMNAQRQIDLKFYPLVGREERQLPIFRPLLGQTGQEFMLIEVTGSIDQPEITRTPFPRLDARLAQLFPELARDESVAPKAPAKVTPREALNWLRPSSWR
jgi:1-pyrroline-5-carboxylate dehydrogenase